jgi:lysozyme family protein
METPRFIKFMPLILEHEGGFVNNAKDPGGATKFGISLRFLRSMGQLGDIDHDGDVDIDDIRALTPETVRPFYLNKFYNAMRIEEITSDQLAIQVFDFGVNAGPSRAIITLQRLIGATPDGVIGPDTLKKLNAGQPCMFPTMYMNARISFYEQIVAKNKDLAQFLAGWKRRANHCVIK